MPSFPPDEREHLHAFLTATEQILESSVVAGGGSLAMRFDTAQDGTHRHELDVFDDERFRSLAISVRLIYMNDEPSNFAHICNILRQRCEAVYHQHVDAMRAAYNNHLNGQMIQFGLHGDFEGTIVGPRETLEAWLYGGTFHNKDPQTRALFAELRKFGPRFNFGVQMIILQLVQVILNLRSLVLRALQDEAAQGQSQPPAT